MTHIFSERVVGVPAQPVTVAPISNVKFEINGIEVALYETPEAFNNVDVFETFDLARAAAVQAFAQHKADVLAAITQTEKELLTSQGPSKVAVAPVAPVIVNDGIAPTAVAAKSPAVGTSPII